MEWDNAESRPTVVLRREKGQSKGRGFDVFKIIKQAEEALKFNGKNVNGRKLIIEKYQSKEQRLAHTTTITAAHTGQGHGSCVSFPNDNVMSLMTLLQQLLKLIQLFVKIVMQLTLFPELQKQLLLQIKGEKDIGLLYIMTDSGTAELDPDVAETIAAVPAQNPPKN